MLLELGMNSYVTTEEANILMEAIYPSTDIKRLAWEKLSISDKRSLLLSATHKLDALPNMLYKGKKSVNGQPLHFPRIIGANDIGIPSDIKVATILLLSDDLNALTSSRAKLQAEGVTKIRLSDGTSEEYTKNKTTDVRYYLKRYCL